MTTNPATPLLAMLALGIIGLALAKLVEVNTAHQARRDEAHRG